MECLTMGKANKKVFTGMNDKSLWFNLLIITKTPEPQWFCVPTGNHKISDLV